MLSYGLGTVIDFHKGLKIVFRYRNLTLIQQLLEKKKKMKCIYSLYPDHLKYEQKERKVKGKHYLKKRSSGPKSLT